MEAARRFGFCVMCSAGSHVHCKTCEKTEKGEAATSCRLRGPRSAINETRPVQLQPDTDGRPFSKIDKDSTAELRAQKYHAPSSNETFPPRDSRLIVFEPRRKRIDPRAYCDDADVLQEVLHQIHSRETARRLNRPDGWRHLDNDSAFPRASASFAELTAYYFPSEPQRNSEIARLIADLGSDVGGEKQRTLQVALLVHLSEQNMLLSDSNPVLAAAAGCSTNVQLLVSREEAVQAIWYIIEYMTKERYDLTTLEPIVLAALRHVRKYPSTAPDALNPTAHRPGRQFLQRIVNAIGSYTQLSLDMAAAHVMGEPAHSSTDPPSWVFWKAAIAHRQREARKMQVGYDDGADNAAAFSPAMVSQPSRFHT